MKIERLPSIAISAKTAAHEVLKNLATGSKTSARVIERLDGQHAILEIAGTRIRAEFLKGVPRGDSFLLVLVDKKGSQYVFSLAQRDEISRHFQAVARDFLIDEGRFAASDLSRLLRGRAGTLGGLYDLNRVLLGIPPERERDRSRMGLLNRLQKAGISRENFNLFYYLFSRNTGINNNFLYYVMSVFGGGRHLREWANRLRDDANALSGMLDNMMDEVRGKIDQGVLEKDAVGELFSMLAGSVPGDADIADGVMPLVDGDEWKPIRYLGREKSLLCSFDLSEIGHVEILAKDFDDETRMLVSMSDAGTAERMRKDAAELVDRIKNFVEKKISMIIYNSDDVLNNINELCRIYPSLYGVDVRA